MKWTLTQIEDYVGIDQKFANWLNNNQNSIDVINIKALISIQLRSIDGAGLAILSEAVRRCKLYVK